MIMRKLFAPLPRSYINRCKIEIWLCVQGYKIGKDFCCDAICLALFVLGDMLDLVLVCRQKSLL